MLVWSRCWPRRLQELSEPHNLTAASFSCSVWTLWCGACQTHKCPLPGQLVRGGIVCEISMPPLQMAGIFFFYRVAVGMPMHGSLAMTASGKAVGPNQGAGGSAFFSPSQRK
jgi:hypothetical protein